MHCTALGLANSMNIVRQCAKFWEEKYDLMKHEEDLYELATTSRILKICQNDDANVVQLAWSAMDMCSDGFNLSSQLQLQNIQKGIIKK